MIARSALTIFLAKTATRFLQLFTFVILARILSPHGFGDYGVIISAVFLGGLVGNLGIRQSTARLIAREDYAAGPLVSASLLAWPALSVATCVAIFWLLDETIGRLSSLGQVAVIIAVTSFMHLTIIQGALLGQSNIRDFSIAESGPRFAHLVFVLPFLLVQDLTLDLALMIFGVGFLVFIPYVTIMAYRNQADFFPAISQLPRLVGSGFVFAASLFLVMLQGRIGLFFLQGAEGATQAGLYFAAQRVSEIFLDTATAVALVLFAEAARSKDAGAASAIGIRMSSLFLIVFSILGAAVYFLAPLVVEVVLGAPFAGAVEPLQIVSLGLGPVAACRVLTGVMTGIGKPNASSAIALVGLVINFGVCAVAIPLWQSNGAAMGFVAGQLACYLIYLYFFRGYLKPGLHCALQDICIISRRIRDTLKRAGV
ncbi:oligosaccharide flippase family protein [Geminicoccus roseus]|uniref:oligosaccharide flippase family protein n=1 Tax=Geminicoccus roseus TaxID=404900 RepID=UPI000A01294F|nr:polysaccharide biosynthesis C-terminal domain-containing protein [Geminicoccus roseus]